MTKLICSNIFKSYVKSTLVLDSVSLDLKPGVYGLLGANGAGKTTLMQVITSLMPPDKGVVTYCDRDIYKDRKSYRGKLGYWPQECSLPGTFTVEELLSHISQFKNVRYTEAKSQIEQLLLDFNLYNKKDNKIKTLSGGERQRLGISQAFLGSPEVIVLDEPTRGLDIHEQNRMYEYILRHNDKIVLISSHVVHDIEETCSSVIIIDKGKILYSGSIVDAMQQSGEYTLEDVYLHLSKKEEDAV